jgi:starvation-inducible DNA-binding protein
MDALNPLIADAFVLYVKTKNYHWHVAGPHFRDYHLLFDEQADQLLTTIDLLAERVRRIGGTTIRSISHIGRLQSLQDDNEAYVPPAKMVRRLLEDHAYYVQLLRAAHGMCEQHQDVATASVLETLLDEAERRMWFLFECSQLAAEPT